MRPEPTLACLDPPRPTATARRRRTPAAASLAWGFVFFALGQAVLGLTLYVGRPELRDPEYGQKLIALRRQVADKPGAPVVVVLGSSRVAMGLRPEVLAAGRSPGEGDAVVFNYALLGAGPVLELLTLRRLLHDGVRPDWVVVECWPPFLHQEGTYAEENRLDVNRLDWHDRGVLRPYVHEPRRLLHDCLFAHLLPAFAHRFILLSRYAPDWVAWNNRRDDGWRGLDAFGWLPRRQTAMSAAEHRQAVEHAQSYFAPLCARVEVAETSDRALRELFALCRKERIAAALLVMPEASEFQHWYPPQVRLATDEYLVRLSREEEVPLVNTRDWMSDADFIDGFHLLPPRAAAFTERFGREVLRPLLGFHEQVLHQQLSRD